MNTSEIIKAVKELAVKNYKKGHGWQVIVECYTDAEIEEELKEENITTKKAALKHFTWLAKIRTDHHKEIMSTVW